MNENITDFFLNLIRQSGSYDIAESEFRRMVAEDDELRDQYREWCEENGYSERNGFNVFCDECFSRQKDAMDSLNDYDE